MEKMNFAKDFNTLHGDLGSLNGARYQQGDRYFDVNGNEVDINAGQPVVEPLFGEAPAEAPAPKPASKQTKVATPKATPKAEPSATNTESETL